MGWQRRIVIVLEDYLDKQGKFGYSYDENYDGKWHRGLFTCSQDHLVRWSKK
jgi:hypothetical protein